MHTSHVYYILYTHYFKYTIYYIVYALNIILAGIIYNNKNIMYTYVCVFARGAVLALCVCVCVCCMMCVFARRA